MASKKKTIYPIVARLNLVTGQNELYMLDNGELTCYDGSHGSASFSYYHTKTKALPDEIAQVVFNRYIEDWESPATPVLRKRLTR